MARDGTLLWRRLAAAWRETFPSANAKRAASEREAAQREARELGLALIEACRSGEADTARTLLGAGADPDFKSMTCPMAEAIIWDRRDCARLLIDAGAKLDGNFCYGFEGAAVLAVCVDRLECLEMLIEAGADLEAVDLQGRTALTLAAFESGDPERRDYVTRLLRGGADVNGRDCEGRTALMLAAHLGLDVGVRRLIEAGADLDGSDAGVRRLIDAGADLEAVSQWMLTALMLAAMEGNANCVRMLVEAGADVERVDAHSGCTAAGLAERHEHESCAQFLRSAMLVRSERAALREIAPSPEALSPRRSRSL